MVTWAVEALKPRAVEAGVSIDVRVADGPAVHVDPDRMEQVLVNLLSNGIKCNRPGGTVSVLASCDAEAWTLAVRDDGIGIPVEEQHRLFERFARATNARDARIPGTGLGLAISRDIVELHGGSIGLESAPDAGTAVFVRLPHDAGASGGDG